MPNAPVTMIQPKPYTDGPAFWGQRPLAKFDIDVQSVGKTESEHDAFKTWATKDVPTIPMFESVGTDYAKALNVAGAAIHKSVYDSAAILQTKTGEFFVSPLTSNRGNMNGQFWQLLDPYAGFGAPAENAAKGARYVTFMTVTPEVDGLR